MRLKIYTLFQPVQANGRVPSNKYVEITPSPKLAPYVSCYWFSEPVIGYREPDSFETFKALREESVDRVLPDGCSDIIFEHDLKENKYRTLFSGVFDEPFTISYDRNHPMRKFGVRFFPGGIHSLLGIPQQDFAKSHFDLDLVWTGMTKEIEDRLFEEPLIERKVRVMEDFLVSFMSTNTIADDHLINKLLYHIFVTEGKTSVKELAKREAISTRQMNRIFYRWIGISPKRFCEVVRFQSIVKDIQRSPSIVRCLAYKHGFFDQAHMMRDFKRFYGDSLSVAVREFGNMSDFYNT
ncbi:MAG TPA: helix-turn-helix domain-containing protein [Bacilli bacterium]